MADADVILVADIDRGGVFASIAGTFSLLPEIDRKRIKGIIINKFRGNLDILKPGIKQIEKIVGVPVLGVLPYDDSLKLPEEDSASLTEHKYSKEGKIKIAVIRLPRISNFTDIDPLEYEPDVSIKLIEMSNEIGDVDAIIIPGTRNSVNDMIALKESGLADEIRLLSTKIPVFGICGGYQLMGTKIIDKNFQESKHGSIDGLGLLHVQTIFGEIDKIITQSHGKITGKGIFEGLNGEEVKGYELHEGVTFLGDSEPLLNMVDGCGNNIESGFDGAVNGLISGTYFHGIFHNFRFRRFFTDYLRSRKGLEKLGFVNDNFEELKEFSIDRLAEIVIENIDMGILEEKISKK
jgi:adenosylcobyric acid synthase